MRSSSARRCSRSRIAAMFGSSCGRLGVPNKLAMWFSWHLDDLGTLGEKVAEKPMRGQRTAAHAQQGLDCPDAAHGGRHGETVLAGAHAQHSAGLAAPLAH